MLAADQSDIDLTDCCFLKYSDSVFSLNFNDYFWQNFDNMCQLKALQRKLFLKSAWKFCQKTPRECIKIFKCIQQHCQKKQFLKQKKN